MTNRLKRIIQRIVRSNLLFEKNMNSNVFAKQIQTQFLTTQVALVVFKNSAINHFVREGRLKNIEMIQEAGRCYLVASVNESEETEYLLSMITENQIKGILPCSVRNLEGKRTLCFDVTNRSSLDMEYDNRHISIEEISQLFENISRIFHEGRKYLLIDTFFILEPEHIYYDSSLGEHSIMYLPQKCLNSQEDRYAGLADFLLRKVNQNDNAAVKIAYSFYKMSKFDTFSLEAFKEIIDKERVIVKSAVVSEDIPEFETETSYDVDYERQTRETGFLLPIIMFSLFIILLVTYIFTKDIFFYANYVLIASIIFGMIAIVAGIRLAVTKIITRNEQQIENDMREAVGIVYWGSEETQVFDDRTQVFSEGELGGEVSLCYKENGVDKKYRILSYPVIIGKMASEVDCLLHDQSVSRIHARIEKKDGALTIWDINSTNGTTVDGVRISPTQGVVVDDNSNIRLGNVNLKIVRS